MHIEQLKIDMSMVQRYLSMRVDETPYKFGGNDFVDSFLTTIDPFVQAVSSHRLTEPDYYWIYDVYSYPEGIVINVEHRFGSRENIDLPYELLIGGTEGLPRYLKEKEFNSVVDQIQTVKEHITKCQGRLATLEQRLNTMVAELWPEENNNEH